MSETGSSVVSDRTVMYLRHTHLDHLRLELGLACHPMRLRILIRRREFNVQGWMAVRAVGLLR